MVCVCVFSSLCLRGCGRECAHVFCGQFLLDACVRGRYDRPHTHHKIAGNFAHGPLCIYARTHPQVCTRAPHTHIHTRARTCTHILTPMYARRAGVCAAEAPAHVHVHHGHRHPRPHTPRALPPLGQPLDCRYVVYTNNAFSTLYGTVFLRLLNMRGSFSSTCLDAGGEGTRTHLRTYVHVVCRAKAKALCVCPCCLGAKSTLLVTHGSPFLYGASLLHTNPPTPTLSTGKRTQPQLELALILCVHIRARFKSMTCSCFSFFSSVPAPCRKSGRGGPAEANPARGAACVPRQVSAVLNKPFPAFYLCV